MISDNERREVAARLRELHLNTWDDAACQIAQCIGIECCNSECHGSNENPECAMALCDRLADLIEPDKTKVKCVAEVKVDGERLEKLAHDAMAELTGIDRDALLALASCVRKMGEDYDKLSAFGLGTTFRAIADRIREALGASDG